MRQLIVVAAVLVVLATTVFGPDGRGRTNGRAGQPGTGGTMGSQQSQQMMGSQMMNQQIDA